MFWGCNCLWFCCSFRFCSFSHCFFVAAFGACQVPFILLFVWNPLFSIFLNSYVPLILYYVLITLVFSFYPSFFSNSSLILCFGILFSLTHLLQKTSLLSLSIFLLSPSCQLFWIYLYFHKGRLLLQINWDVLIS